MRTRVLVLALAASACAGQVQAPSGPRPMPATLEEATAEIESFRRMYGVAEPPVQDEPVRSMQDVLAILRADELQRYPDARSFADGAQGMEALTVRSLLELTWAGGIRTARGVLKEIAERLDAEVRTLEVRRDPTEQDLKRLQEMKDKAMAYRRVTQALLILSQPHLDAGSDLMKEALRRYPNAPEAHVAAAFYHRLTKNWVKYDEEDRLLQDLGFTLPVLEFTRAMVQLERLNNVATCRRMLTDLRDQDPTLVRAQAELVLIQEDIESTYAELVRLKDVQPDHFLIRLAGPIIEQEYDASRALRGG